MAHGRRSKEGIAESAVGVSRFRAQYDAVTAGAKKLRRQPRIETTGETGADSNQLPPYKRLLMINLCRDAVRNFSSARGIVRQIGANVAGSLFKLSIKQEGEAARKAETWFNTVFARNCDFRAGMHISDFNRVLMNCVVVDGDVGLAFDDGLLGTGKLIAYESDQICDPTPLPEGVAFSRDGVLQDAYGRTIGYFTTHRCGAMSVPAKDGFFWKCDLEDRSRDAFKLLFMPWRHNQTRGTSDLFTVVADLLDVYEMRSKELQSAKVAASLAAVVKKKTAVGNSAFADPRLDPNVGAQTAEDGGGQEGQGEPREESNYDRLEALTGGYTEYLDPDDEVEMLDPNRPNINTEEFTRRIVKSAAAGCGLAQCYANLEVSSSYTAARAEMILTWVQINLWQKWYERNIQDFEAIRAIRFAMETGAVPQIEDGWEYQLMWQHPTMPAIDPEKEQRVMLSALQNGLTSMRREFGPNAHAMLREIADDVAAYEGAGLVHPMFRQVAGAAPQEKVAEDPADEGGEGEIEK